MKLGDVLRAVLLVAIIAAIAGVAGYAISSGEPEEYEARTEMIFESYTSPELNAVGFGLGGSEIDRRMATFVKLLESRDVAVRVARSAPDLGYNVGEVEARVRAGAIGTSDIVQLIAKSESPAKAARLLRTYRREFKFMRRLREQQRARLAIASLERALVELPPRFRAGSRGDSLRAQIGQLEILRRVGTGLPQVTQGTVARTAAVAPATERNTLFGLLFGALIGVGLVALRQAARRQHAAPRASAERDERRVRSDWD
jgi:capsular polysaccharide biosynthesis protein